MRGEVYGVYFGGEVVTVWVTGGMNVRPEVWALAGGQVMLTVGQGALIGWSGRYQLEVGRVH